jgi:hypothetical protein
VSGGVETVPAEPGGGGWVVVAWIPRTDRHPSVALFGVLLTDGRLLWSTDADLATTFLTRQRAVDVIGAGRRRLDVPARARVYPERIDHARGVARVSVTGALGE